METTTTSTKLGEAIREARGERTQRVASIAFECTEKTLGSWEAGRSRPTERKHIRALAREGVQIELLLADDEDAAAGGR